MIYSTVAQRVLLSSSLSILPVLSAGHFQHLLRVQGITHSTERSYGSHAAACTALSQIHAQNVQRNTPTVVGTTPALPAVLVHASGGGNGRNSSNGDGSRDWYSWFGLAAAAAVAAAGAGVLADADDRHDDKAHQAAVSSAELAVSEAFQEVLQDWDRTAAQQQQPGAGSSSSSKWPPSSATPLQPQVQLDGQFLTVTIPLLHGADVPALLRLIDQKLDQLALHSSSSSQQQQSRLMGTSKLVQWDISRTTSKPPSAKQTPGRHSNSREQLKVQVVLPLQPGGSPHENSSSSSSSSSSTQHDASSQPDTGPDYGYVSVAKPNGAFTADELALLARLVAAANKPGDVGGGSSRHVSEDSWLGPFGLPGSSSHYHGGALFPGPFGGLAENMLGRLFGDVVSEIFDELDIDMHSGQGWQQQLQQQWQDAEQQLKDSVPPEVIKWLQDFQKQQQQQADMERQNGTVGEAAAAVAGSSPAAAGPGQQQVLPWQTGTARSAAQQLQQLGAQVYYPPAAALAQQQQHGTGVDNPSVDQDWGSLAGYEDQKQALEDFLLLPIKHPEVFDRVASRTRKQKSANGGRPRAVLFEGPPGTGKTSSARLLSQRAALPLVYVPLEALVSKWYGESEQNLAKLFKACESIGGCIIFLDELDSLATSRDRADMHEASRRLLGVLLREIDGFDNTLGSESGTRETGTAGANTKGGAGSSRRSVLIGATNRRQDLDAALLSRFDVSIHFGLPDEQCRAAILQQYANHLSSQELSRVAEKTPGFSGRDLRDVCEQTERQWASRIIRGEVDAEHLPGIDDYLANVRQRKDGAGASGRGGGHPWMTAPGMPGQYRT